MKQHLFPGWDKNDILKLIKSDNRKILLVNNQVYMSWALDDETSQRFAIVQLYKAKLGTQKMLANIFNIHVSSVQRYIIDFFRDGISGLFPQQSGPKNCWKITPDLRAHILLIFLKEKANSYEAVQKKLEKWNKRISLSSIRQVLLENGFISEKHNDAFEKINQTELFNHENNEQLYLKFTGQKKAQKIISEIITDKKEIKESMERKVNLYQDEKIKAKRYYSQAQRRYLDQLEGNDYSAYAGGLLFIPLIDHYSFLPILKKVISISTYEGFSLEEICLTLFFFDLFRFRSMEDFKTVYPEEFGILIGREYNPSLFTLRRFLHRVRELKISEKLMDEFAYEYIRSGIVNYGVIYIDGHFIPYYGMHSVKKGWHGVRKAPMKGSYSFIGVDKSFTPWIYLVKSTLEDLLEKIPEIINKAKETGKRNDLSENRINDLIVIFDREGYSAELFRYLDGKDKDDKKRRVIFISWAKYSEKWVNEIEEKKFEKKIKIVYEIQEAEKIKYFETERTMNKYGKIRAIVIQSKKNNKRIAIYTNGPKDKIKTEKVIQLMCRRWGEENLIKELMSKHLIDYTPGYFMEEMDEQPLIENPKIKELKKERSKLVSGLQKLKVKLAEKILVTGDKNKTLQDIRKDQREILSEIIKIDNEKLLLDQRMDKLPKKICYDEAHDGKRLSKMNYEKKLFLDCIKIFTCNLEKKMCEILLKYYDNKKDVMSILSMIVHRGGYVKLIKGKLFVQLRNFKNREINYIARHLCEELNAMYPITLDKFQLPLFFEVL